MLLSTASLEPDDVASRTGVARFVRDEIVRTIATFAEVERAALYGSRARGDFLSYSDIDVAIFGDRVTWQTAAQIKDTIDDTFIVFPVDVTAVSSLAPDSSLRQTIDLEGIVIYDRASDPSAPTAR